MSDKKTKNEPVRNCVFPAERELAIREFADLFDDLTGQVTYEYNPKGINVAKSLQKRLEEGHAVYRCAILTRLDNHLKEKTGLGFMPSDIISADSDGNRPFLRLLFSPGAMKAMADFWRPRDEDGAIKYKEPPEHWFQAEDFYETDSFGERDNQVALWCCFVESMNLPQGSRPKQQDITPLVLGVELWKNDLEGLYQVYERIDRSIYPEDAVLGDFDETLKAVFEIADKPYNTTDEKLEAIYKAGEIAGPYREEKWGRENWNLHALRALELIRGWSDDYGFEERLEESKARMSRSGPAKEEPSA